MKKLYPFFLPLLVIVLSACTSRNLSLTILETTDTHGKLDEMSNDATFIESLRDSLNENLILLDCGDNLQGTTFVYCSNHDTAHQHLFSKFFNELSYDAVMVGNHDIEAGKDVFDRVYSETAAPVICANVIDEATNEPYFQPYTIIDREGFKIAVLGLLTPYVTTWVPERLRQGLRFEQLESSAEKWMTLIREKENPDLMIGLFHSGWDWNVEDIVTDTALGRENAIQWVAENVAGLDLIFYGHDHKAKADFVINQQTKDTVWVLNAGSRGNGLAKAEVQLSKGKRPSVHVSIVPTQGPEKDTEFDQMLQPYLEAANAYQNRYVSILPVDITTDAAYTGPSLWVDEIHRLQLEVVEKQGIKADVSFAAPLSSGKSIAAGPLSVRDFFTWYPFENGLSVLSMRGDEIKRFLEYAYSMKQPIYNFDSGAGLLYEVNDDKPEGERIHILDMADGSAFDPEKTYQVVMNSYRAMGGGGHLIKGLGWSQNEIKEHVIWESDKDLRSLFIDWAAQKPKLDSVPLNQWEIK